MRQEYFTKEQFWLELDTHGEEKVLVKLHVEKSWGTAGEKFELARLWLAKQEQSRALAASIIRDSREEKTLRLATWANIIAIVAIIIAAIAAREEIMQLIASIISWIQKFK